MRLTQIDQISLQQSQEIENFTSLQGGKTSFKLTPKPVQAKRKGIFELKILNFTARDNLLTCACIADHVQRFKIFNSKT